MVFVFHFPNKTINGRRAREEPKKIHRAIPFLQGDTYDRVKDAEDVAFQAARASVIDDVESMMSDTSRKKYE